MGNREITGVSLRDSRLCEAFPCLCWLLPTTAIAIAKTAPAVESSSATERPTGLASQTATAPSSSTRKDYANVELRCAVNTSAPQRRRYLVFPLTVCHGYLSG